MGKMIIAAVRNERELQEAIGSNVRIVFMLVSNVLDIKNQADMVHGAGKKFFVHIDLAEGIGKDECGIRFVKSQGADGIISTRTNIINLAKKEKLVTVQRFFAVDSKSVSTAIETAKSSKADMIEIMPGTVTKAIEKIRKDREHHDYLIKNCETYKSLINYSGGK